MPCYLTDSEGISRLNPTQEEQARMLHDWLSDKTAFGEICLTDQATGWTLSVFPTGLVRLERGPGRELGREIGPLSAELVIYCWELLSCEQFDVLLQQPWREATAP